MEKINAQKLDELISLKKKNLEEWLSLKLSLQALVQGESQEAADAAGVLTSIIYKREKVIEDKIKQYKTYSNKLKNPQS